MNRKLKIAIVLNALCFIFEVIGLVYSINQFGLGLVEFYTEDSNLVALAACLFMTIAEYKMLKDPSYVIPVWVKVLKYAGTCVLTLTFLVVVCVLIPMQGGLQAVPQLLFSQSMLYHHLICPILIFISFVFFDPIKGLKKTDTLAAMIPTIIYAFVLIILNALRVVEGPYPFLRIYEQPVYMSCIWVAAILGGAWLIAYLYQRVSNR